MKHCKDCLHTALTTAPDHTLVRMCRYNPPTAVPIVSTGQMGPEFQIISVWPNVPDEGTCGHWEGNNNPVVDGAGHETQ